MKKLCVLFVALLLAANFYSCKSTSYASQSGVDKSNPAYTGTGGETKEVTVKGIAQITSSGEQDAFNRAKEQAMREAVEQVLGSMVSSETLVENSKLVSDNITSKSSGFVQRYNILSDSRDGNTKIVELKAWVVVADVKDVAGAIGLLMERMNKPKILVLMEEKDITTGTPTSIAKSTLHQKLGEQDFEFVDEGQLKKVLASRNLQISKLTGVSDSELAAVAVDAGAQILLKGQVSSAEQNVSSALPQNWKSCRTTVNVDAIYAADASIVASSSMTRPAALLDLASAQRKSIKDATGKLSEDLLDKLLKKWDNMINNGFEYDVIVIGVEFADCAKIKGAFEKNIEGVKKVFQKSFNNNTLTLLVRYSGIVPDLASMVAADGKMPLPIKVKSYTSKSITMSK